VARDADRDRLDRWRPLLDALRLTIISVLFSLIVNGGVSGAPAM